MKRKWKQIGAAFMALALVISPIQPKASTVEAVDAAAEEYEIYPLPQQMTYKDGSWTLAETANVVVEKEIDEATTDRLNETLALKDITAQSGTAVQNGKLNVLVGIHGSGGAADTYVKNNYQVPESLFEKTDAYFLASAKDTLVVVGAHTDAAFYGLTSLYHILKQMDGMEIRNFEMQDWANVVSRGFIEGYYGNPWSTENRADLMTWGGYYKLNSYFYAPKDDPKHNSDWKGLYTEEEIETKIKPLAEAGNKSKCRFVYALHPYMNNAIRYTDDTVYTEDMNALKAKFKQVIDAGVRQIAILADDAKDVGTTNYQRTLEDMSAWLQEMQKTYPDLKTTLPFCPVDYGGNGAAYMKNLPANVQVVMTGGRVWGEVTDSFTSTFMSNTGRGPYMWINWPCTDNSKNHLIMGGYTTFLHAGVDPTKIQGIVLNPMQQSEPSKVAIFGNACYSWNIWETNEEGEQAWYDSFKYVDHNSAIETEASEALRDISRHMINQAMDTRVTALEESQNISAELTAFESALAAGTVTEEQIDSLIEIFAGLKQSAAVFRENPGNPKVRDQMIYWLECWEDTTTAAVAYLGAIKANLNGADDNTLLKGYNEGRIAFANSKTHGFNYVGETKYAEVGVQYIVPLIEQLEENVSLAVQKNIGIDLPPAYKVIRTERWTLYQGDDNKMYDGDDGTCVWYNTQSSDTCKAGDFIGYDLGRKVKIGSIHIVMGNGTDNGDKMLKYAVEVSSDNNTWTAVPGYAEYTGQENAADTLNISVDGLEAQYIRIRNLEDRKKWLKISEFTVQEASKQAPEKIYTNIETDLTLQKADGEAALAAGSVTLKTNDYIGIALSNIRQILSVTANVPDTLKLEISKNGIDWEEKNSGDARYVRVVNKGTSPVTWEITNFKVSYYTVGNLSVESDFGVQDANSDMRNTGAVGNVFDGNLGTYTAVTGLQQQGKYVLFDLGKTINFKSLRYYIVEDQKDYPRDVIFETADSKTASQWSELLHIKIDGFTNTSDVTTAKEMDGKGLTHDNENPGYMYAEATGLNASGRYLKVRVVSAYNYRWLGFSEIQINGGAYESREENKDVVSEAIEQPNMVPSNMVDGDISTSYKSSESNSSATYYISEPKETKVIRMFQVGPVSNAKVTGELYDAKTDEKKTMTLGVLGRCLNDIYVPAGMQLLSVKVEWKDVIPEIAEVIFSDAVDIKSVAGEMLEDAAQLRKVDYKGDSRKNYQAAKEKLEAAAADSAVSEEELMTQIQTYSEAVYALEKVEMLELPFGDLDVVSKWKPDPVPDVQNVYSRELITGYGSEPEKLVNGKQVFGALDNVTRGQFVTILYRMEGEPSISQATLEKYKGESRVFKDIEAGDKWYYTNAVIWAAENKIVNGYDNDQTFRPNNSVSRQEMAAFLYRYAGDYLGIDTDASDYDLVAQGFKDATAPWQTLLPAMKWTSKTGIITGKDIGKENGPRLAPFESATRTECAIILTRFLDKDAAGDLPRK